MELQYVECARAARQMVDSEFIAGLRQPRPAAVVGATALLLLQLVVAWTVALYAPLWLLWLPILIHAGVMQGMLLWVHEASHYTLFKDRKLNDIWTDVFFAGPIGMSVAAYRAKHLTHHAHLGTDQDEDRHPYSQPIKGARALLTLFAKVMSGYYGVRLALEKYVGGSATPQRYQAESPRWLAPLVSLVFNGSLFLLCIVSGRWYVFFLVWVYPIIAIAIALNIVRTIAEHQPVKFGDPDGAMHPLVRTTVPNVFEKWLMYQVNFNYHVEHHLFPAVPQHNLHMLHARLKERGFYDAFPNCLQRSGLGRFLRLIRTRTNDDFSEAVSEATR